MRAHPNACQMRLMVMRLRLVALASACASADTHHPTPTIAQNSGDIRPPPTAQTATWHRHPFVPPTDVGAQMAAMAALSEPATHQWPIALLRLA